MTLSTHMAPPLPAGWEEVLDEQSGDVYYYHEASSTTQWEHPADAGAPAAAQGAASGRYVSFEKQPAADAGAKQSTPTAGDAAVPSVAASSGLSAAEAALVDSESRRLAEDEEDFEHNLSAHNDSRHVADYALKKLRSRSIDAVHTDMCLRAILRLIDHTQPEPPLKDSIEEVRAREGVARGGECCARACRPRYSRLRTPAQCYFACAFRRRACAVACCVLPRSSEGGARAQSRSPAADHAPLRCGPATGAPGAH